jgi:hypothetical protein
MNTSMGNMFFRLWMFTGSVHMDGRTSHTVTNCILEMALVVLLSVIAKRVS